MTTLSAPLISLQSPIEVSLENVNAELNNILTNYHAAANGDPLAVATRATTFSLIVYEPSETQHLLTALGYYTGPIDGIGGPRTRAALQAAQRQLGFEASGRATPDLIHALRQQVNARSQSDAELPAASAYALDAGGAGSADDIARQSPCRIIALCPISESRGGVKAHVSVYCPVQKQSGSSIVCCEYITLTGTETELAGVSGFIQSLTIGELPKFLWWKTVPDQDSELFRRLGTFCNLVVLDTSFFEDATTALIKIHELHEDGINIADLNWRRLAAWQELTAEAFDPPSRRTALKEVDQVTLDYEVGNPAQALMYLGWIASRLNWQPTALIREGGDYDLMRIKFMTADQRPVEAELAAIPVADIGDVVGDLIDLKLASTNLDADCCTVICSETRGCMRMEAGGGAQSCRVQQVSPLSDQSPEVLLSQQLQRWGRELLFEESLAVTAQILQLG